MAANIFTRQCNFDAMGFCLRNNYSVIKAGTHEGRFECSLYSFVVVRVVTVKPQFNIKVFTCTWIGLVKKA